MIYMAINHQLKFYDQACSKLPVTTHIALVTLAQLCVSVF